MSEYVLNVYDCNIIVWRFHQNKGLNTRKKLRVKFYSSYVAYLLWTNIEHVMFRSWLLLVGPYFGGKVIQSCKDNIVRHISNV